MYFRKFFAFGLILIFMLTLSVIGLGEEVSSYEDLVTTIENCTGTSLEIDITADLTVPDGWTDVIEVPSALSELVIRINGHDITGNDKCGFLTMDDGSLTVQNGTISRFSNSEGGAIYGVDAITMILSNMTFESNTSTYCGGAVYAGDQSTVTVENSVFKSNKSDDDDGGALYISDGGSCSISDCQFIENTVTENYGGGAICIGPEGTLEISRSSFTGNEADEGGAIYLYHECTLKINTSENEQNTSFINNKAQSIGGAIEATVPKELDIRYSSFSSNSAGNDENYGYGGAIRIEALSDPMMAKITNCSFTENNADYGGAIQYDTCLFVDQSSFSSNTSTYGGGAISQPMTRYLYDTDYDGNKIYAPGILKGTLIIQNSEFTSNLGEGGGAVYVYPSIDEDELNEYGQPVDFGDSITIENSVFSENEAKDGSGGALFFANIIEASLSSVTIDHNLASKRGGGIFIGKESDTFSSRLSISTDSKIHNNTAGAAASDLFSMDGIEIASIPDAASMNVSFRDSGEAIQGWFEDSTPRYSLEHPTTAYSVEQIKTMSASGDVSLIAAPIPLSKIIYAPNGGTGTMNPTAGGVGTTVPISENLFTYPSSTFTGWNTMADGTGAAYAPGDSYTLTAEDLTLYAQWITPVKVVKIWDDANDMDGIRPEELSVSLAQSGQILRISDSTTDATYLLTPAESWMHTFELPAGDYSHIELWEGSADGYTKSQESKLFNENDITIVVINKHTPAPVATDTIRNDNMVEIHYQAEKKWEGNNPVGDKKLPQPEVTVILYADGVETAREVIAANADPATATFSNVPKYRDNDGNEPIAYTIKEEITDPGWVKVGDNLWYSLDGMGKYEGRITDVTVADVGNTEKLTTLTGGTVTNTYSALQTTTTVSVTKLWKDHQNENGVRPNYLKVGLFKDISDTDPVAYIELTGPMKGDAWTGTFPGLNIYDDNGNIIDYSTYVIKEAYPKTYDSDGNPASWDEWVKDGGFQDITDVNNNTFRYDYSTIPNP